MNLYDYLPKEKGIFKEFQQFLFLKLNKDKAKFHKFTSFPDNYKLPLLIEFLESKGVPFLTAMNFYSYKYTGTPFFIDIIKYTIIWEFKRIEANKTTTYTPF